MLLKRCFRPLKSPDRCLSNIFVLDQINHHSWSSRGRFSNQSSKRPMIGLTISTLMGICVPEIRLHSLMVNKFRFDMGFYVFSVLKELGNEIMIKECWKHSQISNGGFAFSLCSLQDYCYEAVKLFP
ncbi:hypothetical protein AVEN_98514-1 [Araneus ventricosus]|uniref:Uncharacterized protein n=1 Tax=Araneus ventricosus TaxID=182803 RepID=A0A4Y2ESY4_ARAVE|nr:hypothetical protein AVEN_98514-1 [Araneus ventricosus]